MALTRLSAGVYRNEQGKTVYSKDGKTANANPTGNTGSKKKANPFTGDQIAQKTTDLAGKQLNNSGLGDTYSNPTDNRTIGADSATTQRLADEAFARVNTDITRREQDERSQLQAELANRGININNPQDPTYQRFMQDQERKFANERAQAQSNAEAGAVATQVGLGGLQETIRTNVVNETAGERNQRLAEIDNLIKMAQEAKKNGFTQQELNINKRIAELKSKGSGGTAAPAQPVVNNTKPPGT